MTDWTRMTMERDPATFSIQSIVRHSWSVAFRLSDLFPRRCRLQSQLQRDRVRPCKAMTAERCWSHRVLQPSLTLGQLSMSLEQSPPLIGGMIAFSLHSRVSCWCEEALTSFESHLCESPVLAWVAWWVTWNRDDEGHHHDVQRRTRFASALFRCP